MFGPRSRNKLEAGFPPVAPIDPASVAGRRLDLAGAAVLLVLCASWGLNQAVMKWAYRDVSPILSAAIRSGLAGGVLYLWCRIKGESLRNDLIPWYGGLILALTFTTEFIFLFVGMNLTLASRGAVLLYSQPFFTAALAHVFIPGDRLNLPKTAGLVLAFAGVALIIGGRPDSGRASLLGDIFCLTAGFFWACSNIYFRTFLASRVTFYQALHWQLVYSFPILILASLFLETPYFQPTLGVTLVLLYQSLAVALVSYLIWYKMLQIFRISILGAFTFLAPMFGVLASRMLMDEPLTAGLIAGLAAVSAGVWLVNRS